MEGHGQEHRGLHEGGRMNETELSTRGIKAAFLEGDPEDSSPRAV